MHGPARYRRMAEPYHIMDGQLIFVRRGAHVHVGEVLDEPQGRRTATLCGIAVGAGELEFGGGHGVTCGRCRDLVDKGHG